MLVPSAEPQPEPKTLRGVALEQYAGVLAALDEGFALDPVLANEALTPAAWRSAEKAWKARLAKAGQASPLFTAFRSRRAEAEDWLARPAPPLDGDLSAWVGFLRAYAASPAPFALLEGKGLGLNDMARLQRRWEKALAGDAELARKAAALAAEGPAAPDRVTAPAPELKPFPWSKIQKAPAAVASAAPRAPVPAPPVDRVAPPVLHEAPLDPAPRPKVARPSFLNQGTALALDVPRGPALPFAAGAPARPPSPLAGTSLALEIPKGPALPFDPHAKPSLPEPAAPAPPPTAAKKLGETSLAMAPSAAPLPFGEAPAAALPKVPPRNKLASMSLSLDIPRGPLPAAKTASTAATPPPAPAPAAMPAPAASAAPPAPAAAAPAPARSAPETAPLPTVQRYASLTIDIAMAPARALETLKRYGLSPAQKVTIDAYYRSRFASDPLLRRSWEEACQTYRDWLAAQAGRR